MKFSDLDQQFQYCIQHYLANSGADPDHFCLDIDAEDEMFYHAVLKAYPDNPTLAYFKYIESGKRTMGVAPETVLCRLHSSSWVHCDMYIPF